MSKELVAAGDLARVEAPLIGRPIYAARIAVGDFDHACGRAFAVSEVIRPLRRLLQLAQEEIWGLIERVDDLLIMEAGTGDN